VPNEAFNWVSCVFPKFPQLKTRFSFPSPAPIPSPDQLSFRRGMWGVLLQWKGFVLSSRSAFQAAKDVIIQ
jgi:hypothetical protein